MYPNTPEEEILEKLFQTHDMFDQIRGKPDSRLDQYFVTKETALYRSLLIDLDDYNNSWVAFLGDMDLISVFVGLQSKPKDLIVLDIDKRIPEIIFNLKMNHKVKGARYVNHDIRLRMLAVLRNQYDYVFMEPPMTIEGLEVYLSRAIQCAKKDGNAKILLSFDIQDKLTEKVYSIFNDMHVEILAHKKQFNKYTYETPLGKKTSDMYVLRVLPGSKETIKEHYLGPLYFRESKTEPKPHRCKCGKIIQIGKKGEYESLSDLKEKGCPECEQKDIFVFDSDIKIE